MISHKSSLRDWAAVRKRLSIGCCRLIDARPVPAESHRPNFLNRELRTELSLLLPEAAPLQGQHPAKAPAQVQQATRQSEKEARVFRPGAPVFVKDFRKPSTPTWVAGKVLQRLGKVRYEVMADGLVWTRHVNHLKDRDDVPAYTTSTPPGPSPGSSRALLRALARSSRSQDIFEPAPRAASPPTVADSASVDEDECSTQSSESGDDGFDTPEEAPGETPGPPAEPAEVASSPRPRRPIKPPSRLHVDPSRKSYR